MKAIFSILAVLMFTGVSGNAQALTAGTTAPNYYPYMGYVLGSSDKVDSHGAGCATTLISDQWMVTSAQCLLQYNYFGNRSYPKGPDGSFQLSEENLDMVVYYGNQDLTKATRVRPAKVVFHPGFLLAVNKGPMAPDVALIKLPAPVAITPMTMMRPGENAANSHVRLLGWGATQRLTIDQWDLSSAQARTTRLREAQTVATACTDSPYGTNTPKWVRDQLVCAKDPAQRVDYCGGDMGAPILRVDAHTGKYVLGGINLDRYEDCDGRYSIHALDSRFFYNWAQRTMGSGPAIANAPAAVSGSVQMKCYEQYCDLNASNLRIGTQEPVDVVWTLNREANGRIYTKTESGIAIGTWLKNDAVYDVAVRLRQTTGEYAVHSFTLDMGSVYKSTLSRISGDFLALCEGLRCKFDASKVNFGGIQLSSVIWFPYGMKEGTQLRGKVVNFAYPKASINALTVTGFDPNGKAITLQGGLQVFADNRLSRIYYTDSGEIADDQRLIVGKYAGFEAGAGMLRAVLRTWTGDRVGGEVKVIVQRQVPGTSSWRNQGFAWTKNGIAKLAVKVEERGMYRYKLRAKNGGASWMLHVLANESDLESQIKLLDVTASVSSSRSSADYQYESLLPDTYGNLTHGGYSSDGRRAFSRGISTLPQSGAPTDLDVFNLFDETEEATPALPEGKAPAPTKQTTTSTTPKVVDHTTTVGGQKIYY